MTEQAGPRPDRPAHDAVFHARLGEQLERLRREPAWRAGDRNAVTLFKTPALSLVLLAMKEAARLQEHRTDGSLTIQAVSGRCAWRRRAAVSSSSPARCSSWSRASSMRWRPSGRAPSC